MAWPPKSPDYSPALQARIDAAMAAQPQQRKAHRKPRFYPEANLQIECVEWIEARRIPPARFWFVPNGGNLSKVQRAKFKQMGLTRGVSDLHFAWRAGAMTGPGLYGVIELKAPGSTGSAVSPDQVQFLTDMAANGHKAAVCASLEQVRRVLAEWRYPLHSGFL